MPAGVHGVRQHSRECRWQILWKKEQKVPWVLAYHSGIFSRCERENAPMAVIFLCPSKEILLCDWSVDSRHFSCCKNMECIAHWPCPAHSHPSPDLLSIHYSHLAIKAILAFEMWCTLTDGEGHQSEERNAWVRVCDGTRVEKCAVHSMKLDPKRWTIFTIVMSFWNMHKNDGTTC